MKRHVKQQGHTHNLFIQSLSSSCGDIESGGVAFEFGDCGGTAGVCALLERSVEKPTFMKCVESGPWLVPLDELKAIVAEAEAYQGELSRPRWANQHGTSDDETAHKGEMRAIEAELRAIGGELRNAAQLAVQLGVELDTGRLASVVTRLNFAANRLTKIRERIGGS
jgi:hypothetical protein